MQNHVIAKNHALIAPVEQRWHINLALNQIHVLQPRQIALHNVIHRMRKIHHDHMAAKIFSKPFGLRTAHPPSVHHKIALKRVGAAKGVGHNMFEPVDLEIEEVEIFPLIAKQLNACGRHVVNKTGNAVDDGIALIRWSHQRTGLDSAIGSGDRID